MGVQDWCWGVEQSSRPANQDLLVGFFLSLPAGPLDEFAVGEGRARADHGNEVGAVTACQRSCAASMSLNAIGTASAPPDHAADAVRSVITCENTAKICSNTR